MKAIVFAGGRGTRLWPLSRKDSPKQFEKVLGDKSTLQLSVERLISEFDKDDIYVATAQRYASFVSKQLPFLDKKNVIFEPVARDVGPAVGLVAAYMYKKFPNEPVVILWSDHIVQNQPLFAKIIKIAGKLVKSHNNKLIFISQKPRFPSQNLGWIKLGKEVLEKDGIKVYSFEKFHYRPEAQLAEKFFESGKYAWNLGYFVTTSRFLWSLFKNHQKEMFKNLQKIYKSIGGKNYKNVVEKIYPQLPKVSFDSCVLEKMDKEDAWIISENLGWSDVGTWDALKEALQSHPTQNVTSGKVLFTDCEDTLVYNYTDQMVVAIDLDGFLVINTDDVVLICQKDSAPKIKKLVKKLAQSNKSEHLV